MSLLRSIRTRSRRPGVLGIVTVVLATWLTVALPTGASTTRGVVSGPSVTLKLPASWSKATRADGRIVLTGPGGATGLVWPLLMPEKVSERAAAVVLGGLARAYVSPGLAWGAARVQGAGVLVARGTGGGRSGVAVLRYASTAKATVGTLFAFAAPKAAAPAAAKALAPAFASFKVAGAAGSEAGAGAGDAGIQYVAWTDPSEGAFHLQVPKGWTVKGGLARFAAIDVRMGVTLASPDGHMTILIGDSTLPAFAVPNSLLAAAGFPEGSNYPLGQGVVQRVLHYIGGVDFADTYGSTLAQANGCTGVDIVDKRARPDTVAELNRIQAGLAQAGASVRTDAGEEAFACSIGKRAIRAYVFAATTLVTTQNVGTWYVPNLYIATADAASMGQAEAVLRHVVGSYQQDAKWTAAQQNLTLAASKAATRSAQAISDSIASSYWAKAASDDRLSELRSDTTLGLANTVDPVTGDAFKVDASSTYHWIDHNGNIAGTDVSTAPSTDFRPLLAVGR